MANTSKVDPIMSKDDRCWLKWPVNDDRPPIRWTSKGGPDGRIELAGLTPKELEAVEAFLAGTSYVRCINGRLHAYKTHEPLPRPEEDPLIGPHWRNTGEPKVWGGIPSGEGWHSPGIIITGLGAGLSPDGFGNQEAERNQALVESFGFDCLRSRRGDDGKYWEQWVLHFLEAAKGDLLAHLNALPRDAKWHQRAESAADFIAKQVRFGSLDIVIQRWALSYD